MIFVFGSNLAGVHGAGAAKYAMNVLYAQYGVGVGRTGGCYAIPTKDMRIRTLPLSVIELHVKDFMEYAEEHPDLNFKVTRLGCGLAGYTDSDIAPMFEKAPANCSFDAAWTPYLGRDRSYWGTV